MTIHVFPGTVPELGIQLDSPEWFEWLSQQLQFKYCGNCTEMSVKRRASNGKWYARKKVYSSDKGSVPIDLYVGTDSDCTAEKLIELNYYFGLEWQKFWQWYHSPARRGEKGKGVQQEMSTSTTNPSQTGEEIAQLRAEVERLKQREGQLLDQLGLVKSQIVCEAQERARELEARIVELDNANWECEKQLTTYSELHRKSELKRQELQVEVEELRGKNLQLKAQLHEAEDKYINIHEAGLVALNTFLDEIGKEPTGGRDWTWLVRFRSWLQGI
jgi:hypothetical protein